MSSLLPTHTPLRRRSHVQPGWLALTLLSTCIAGIAHAGAELNFGPNKKLNLGFGMRTSFTSLEDAAPNGSDDSSDFEIDNLRLYLGGQLSPYIKGTFNTERKSNGDITFIDAIAQFELSDALNIWVGRMLPPTDRLNLAGPFYATAYDFPGVAQNYPAIVAGRDEGVTVWGKLAGKRVVYGIGAYEGHNNTAGGSNDSDKLLFAGRLAFNFWEPEPAPAYYTGSTYYGGADILTVGLGFVSQTDGVGVAGAAGDYSGYNIDLLMEKKLPGGGAVDFELAYYNYDLDGVLDCNSGEPGAPLCPSGDNVGGQVAGDSYLLGLAYLLPQKLGPGRLMPYLRYQQFDRDASNTENTQLDLGVHYVISGPNARLTFQYSQLDDERNGSDAERDRILLGVQLQY